MKRDIIDLLFILITVAFLAYVFSGKAGTLTDDVQLLGGSSFTG